MKSGDGGDNWSKTEIWDHPYDFFLIDTVDIDYFYCEDGSCSIALDNDGIAHVVFGISKIRVTGGVMQHFEEMGGIAYWREGMPVFPGTINSLHPDTLEASGNLISQYNYDYFVKPSYNTLGLATMPSVSIEDDNITVVWSLTQDYFGSYNNHIMSAQSITNGNTWTEDNDLTNDLIHIFDECIYPVIAPNSFMNKWTIVYQYDWEPGLAVNGNHFFIDNYINVLQFEKECYPNYLEVDFIADTAVVNEGDTVFFTNLTESCPSPQWFQWSFEGGIPSTSEEINPVIQYNTSGNYFVSLHSYNGDVYGNEVKQNYIQVLPETGLAKLTKDELFIIEYGLKKGVILIECVDNINKSTLINIFDISGISVFDFKSDMFHQIRIDLSEEPPGTYIVRIVHDKNILTRKIIVN